MTVCPSTPKHEGNHMIEVTRIDTDFNPSPRLHDYMGLWAIRPEEGAALSRMASSANWREHAATNAASNDPRDRRRTAYTIHDNGVAELKLEGTLMKHENSMEASTSTVFARRALRQAAEDERVTAILLRIDSPGGTVSGTDDLAADVGRINKVKPVVAFAEDLMASAAYWIGSQARAVYANSETAMIGSIGTFMGLHDYSEQAKQEGIEAVVFATGELKATGFPGSKITPQQREYLQGLVEQTQRQFDAAVQAGRHLSAKQLTAVSTGRVWKASEAKRLGLIDGVHRFDKVLAMTPLVTASPRFQQAGPMAFTDGDHLATKGDLARQGAKTFASAFSRAVKVQGDGASKERSKAKQAASAFNQAVRVAGSPSRRHPPTNN